MTVLLDAPIDVSTLDFVTYDAYLDSTPLWFMDSQGSEQLSQSIPSEAQRQDTGNNPDEVRQERGFFFAQSDFSGGMGQEKFHAPNSDKDKCYSLRGFDIDERGKLAHHYKITTTSVTNKSVISFAVADDGTLFCAVSGEVNANCIKYTTDLTTFTADVPGGSAGACQDLASDGENLYAAFPADSKVYKRNSAGTWSTYTSGGEVDQLLWGTFLGRLMCVGPRAIYEITASGALPSPIMTLPAGFVWGHMWESGPYIYAAAYSTSRDESVVFHFGLNSGATAIVAKGHTPMPIGELIQGGAGFLNTSYLLGKKRISSNEYADICYQAFPSDDGYLQYVKLKEADNYGGLSGIGTPLRILNLGDSVLIPWTSATSASDFYVGALQHNVARDALSHYTDAHFSLSNTPSDAVFRYRNKIIYGGAFGITKEDQTKYIAEATLITSMADFSTAAIKVHDRIDVTCDPLPSGTSIEVYYTTKHIDQDDWTLAGTIDTADSEGDSFYLTDVESRLFALKIVSNASSDQSLAPVIRGYSVRSNPKPETSEWTLVRTVRIREEDRTQPRAPKKYKNVRDTITTLRNMLHTWVTLYEPGETWSVYVRDMRVVEPKQAINQLTGGSPKEEAYIVTLSMEGTRQ